MRQLLLLSISLLSFQLNAQDYLMQNGSITTCSGTLYDSGGEFGNYSDNENFVFTICPENAEERLRLDFQEFNTELNTDFIMVYDGTDTSGLLFGAFSGTTNWPNITATLNNPTGCLTIEFISNESGNTSGWAANISCTTPCQDITSQLESTNPLPNEDGIIEVCVGDNITFNGSGIFEIDGTDASYTWDLGDGTTAEGESVTISYNQPGVYLVDLNIRDTNTDNFEDGCRDSNTINQIVRVSGTPDFTGTEATDDTLCFGESTTIEAVVNPLTLIYNCPPPESETTFLPDGNGAAYSTCINVTCFDPSAVLTDISQIDDICLNMEHSYLGDLQITIVSPNGQSVILKNFPGGAGLFLGQPIDDDSNLNPGIGAVYCFAMSGSTVLVNGPQEDLGAGNNSISPGTYLPEEPFSALLGSPLNGEWCIEIVDNLAIDNGYIFSWELNFDEAVPQEDFSFIPELTSQSWDADPTITETNGNTISVAPDGSGEFCYTYRTIDVFGCEYTEEVCITVTEEGQPPITYYEDSDGDGFGDAENPMTDCSDTPPPGFTDNSLDCDDGNDLINPDATDDEGDGIDSNCDGADGVVLSVVDININTLNVRPNPFKDEVLVEVSSQLNGSIFQVKIYDINGRVVYNETQTVVDKTLRINSLSELVKAAYFLNISNRESGLNVTKKLIKL